MIKADVSIKCRCFLLLLASVNKRVRKLAKTGFLEQLKPVNDLYTLNTHGRKDYKITMQGMKQLIQYVINRPLTSGKIIEYIEKTGLNMELLGPILLDEFETMEGKVENMTNMAIAINQTEYFKRFLSFLSNIAVVTEDMRRDYFENLNLDTASQRKKDYKTRRKHLEKTITHKQKSN